MKKIIVTCQLITPLFMYGAENKFEIRASSIKGLLRYWWRACNYADEKQHLLKKENEIFGSKDKKSPVSIKINTEKLGLVDTDNREIKEADYLFYSLKLGNGSKKLKTYKPPKAKQSFDIEFRYKDRDENEKIIMEYLKALDAMQLLGGMGSRSRRGAGNFSITDVKVENNEKLKEEIKQSMLFCPAIDDFKSELEKKLKTLIKYKMDKAGEYPNIVGSGFSIYTYQSDHNANHKKNTTEIQTFNSWKEALSMIEKSYKDFRSKENLEDLEFAHEAAAVFGLPFFYDGKSKYEFSVQKREHDKGKKLSRLPSPIIFRIHKTLEDKYIAIVIKLSGGLLDDYSKVWVMKKNENEKEAELRNQKDEKLIDVFLEKSFIKLY